MSENEKNTMKDALGTLAKAANMENIQKYVLGTKKNGAPRAIYDIVKDMTKLNGKGKGKKKKKKYSFDDEFAVYLGPKKKKKKGKKGKKKNKYWRFDD